MAFFRPINLLLLSGLIWFLSFITIPATYVNLRGGMFFPVFTLIVYNILFILGLKSVNKINTKPYKQIPIKKRRALVFVLFLIGTFGVLVRVYQRVFIQKIYFAENLVKTRMELMSGELNSGILGVLSALTYPFATVVLMLVLLWYKNFNTLIIFIVLIIGLFPVYDAILTESRLIIVLTFGMLLICFFASPIVLFKNHKTISIYRLKLFKVPTVLFKKKVWIPTLILFVGFFIFSQNVINNRLAVFSYKDTLKAWEYIHEVEIDNEFKKKVNRTKNKEDKNKLIATYSLKHYFAHGVFEYIRLNNHLEKSWGYYYGMFEMYTYFKILKAIGINIPPFLELNKVSYKPAVYTTFWGPFYIDFGIFGFIISFFIGRLTKRVYLKARKGSEINILIYAFIAVVILGSFFVNLANGGNLYFLNAILVTAILIRVWPNKLILKNT